MCRRGENIYKRKDGRYEGRYVTGRKLNGRTRFGYVYGKNYNEVRIELLRRKAQQLSQADKSGTQPVSFAHWAKDCLKNEIEPCVKESTRQRYEQILNKHLFPFWGLIPLKSITSADIARFVETLREKGLAENTFKSVFGLFSSLLRRAQAEGLIMKNPCKKAVCAGKPAQTQRVLTRAEQQKLYQAAKPEELPCLLAISTGMRLGEICALRREDIDEKQLQITVCRTVQRLKKKDGSGTALFIGKTKSLRGERNIPITKEMLAELLDCCPQNSGYLFGKEEKPADPRSLQRRIHRLEKRAGLSGVHFHTLRHTFCTRLLEIGTDPRTVSELMGHTSVRTTLDFYAHSMLNLKRKAISKLIKNCA